MKQVKPVKDSISELISTAENVSKIVTDKNGIVVGVVYKSAMVSLDTFKDVTKLTKDEIDIVLKLAKHL